MSTSAANVMVVAMDQPLAGVLNLPKANAPTFDTYKHCAALLGEPEMLAVPPLTAASGDNAAGRADFTSDTTCLWALAAEARALAMSSVVVSIVGGRAVAVPHGIGVAFVELKSGGVNVVECGSQMLSLAHAGGRQGDVSETPESCSEELIVAAGSDGTLALVAVHTSSAALVTRLIFSGKLTPRAGQGVAETTGVPELYVTAAQTRADGGVVAMVHSVTGRREVEIAVIVLDQSGCERLATLSGPSVPKGACWCGPSHAMLLADVGFVCQPETSCPEQKNPDVDTNSAVLTAMWLEADSQKPQVTHWMLPCKVWAASTEIRVASSDDAKAAAVGQGLEVQVDSSGALLVVASNGGSEAAVFRVVLPPAPSSNPMLLDCTWVPGLAACASARPHLRLILVSPARSFFALIEACGTSAATVFRNPEGSSRAPTSIVQLDEIDGNHNSKTKCEGTCEVHGVLLQEHLLVVFTGRSVVLTSLDISARVAEVNKPLAAQGSFPMGLDPRAVLQMLDRQGED